MCIRDRFWSLLSGVVATAISFIPHNITQLIAISIFKISTIFANFVTGVADALEKFRFCTLPIHKEYFLLSIILIVTVLIIYSIIFKGRKDKLKKALIFSLCAVIFSLSIFLPCTKLLPATLYITNVENGVNLTLRQGLKYAHFNCGASDNDVYFQYLPKAKSEIFNFLYIGKADKTTNKTTKILTPYSPETTVVTESAKIGLNETNYDLPQNTIIANSYTHNFNNEITIQIVDTYPASCVIISGNKKVVLISYGNNNDLSSVFETTLTSLATAFSKSNSGIGSTVGFNTIA